VKITNREQLEALGVDVEQVMHTLIEAYCEQILVQGFFHADPHPGNLMVIPPEPGATDAKPKVVFLDFGLAKRLPLDFKQGMVRFAVALLQGHPDLMAQALVDLGFATRDDPLESLRSVSAVILDAAKQLRHQSYADPDVLRATGRELADLIRENPLVQVPNHLVLLARVTGLLSGVGKSLGVRIDMLSIILPYALGQLQKPDASADET
jgi:predicted unusual protein kinase regulating ubiquinone biosynthesis (AarF/ABC1/UbiB family)